MRPAEAFGVAVRTIGLLIVLSGTWATLLGVLAIAGGGPAQEASLLLFGILALAVGFFLLRGGANVVVEFAYPEKQP